MIPGGETGVLEGGQAVVGGFGVPGVTPFVAGQVMKNDGTVGPIFRCPTGMVLGKDSICYMKGAIPRNMRKWKPSPKPPMSAADAKALRRIGTLQRKAKKLAGDAGLRCVTRSTRRK